MRSRPRRGSASILLISYGYIKMLGGDGMTEATRAAILNANYIKSRLEKHYPVLYTRDSGRVAHEMIFDLRQLKQISGIDETDVAKRLMDYGFHAPTVSFPVAGTLMVEPTESEPKEELDRFCESMIAIHAEIQGVIEGDIDPVDNVLKNAPHTAAAVSASEWVHLYSASAVPRCRSSTLGQNFRARTNGSGNAACSREYGCVQSSPTPPPPCAARSSARCPPDPPCRRSRPESPARIAIIASQNRSSSSFGSLSVGSIISVPATGKDTVGAWKP